MTREENIRAILESNFAGMKDEIMDNAVNRIMELEQEPATKSDLGVDCISRDDVWDVMQELWGTSGELIDRLMSLPSVTPQKALEQESKKGHWIMTSDYLTTAYGSVDYVKCSCCGEDSLEEGNFCPNCGAEMEEVEV